ncbi:hypothetical protein TYRP_023236 [Tyrophagus putrescentiae]|nr:hypothetical protein TYRP_023236 [Tyrophagus putrescentiae]
MPATSRHQRRGASGPPEVPFPPPAAPAPEVQTEGEGDGDGPVDGPVPPPPPPHLTTALRHLSFFSRPTETASYRHLYPEDTNWKANRQVVGFIRRCFKEVNTRPPEEVFTDSEAEVDSDFDSEAERRGGGRRRKPRRWKC